MATANVKTPCFSCRKETRPFSCTGCAKEFCLNCLTKHVQGLGQELDKIENDHDQFRQTLDEQKVDPKEHSLIQRIDQWEKESINKIKQTAEECREALINHTNGYLIELENKVNSIAKEIKRVREESEFNEIDLKQFKEKSEKLKEELDKPANVSVEELPSSFINKIFVVTPVHEGKTIRLNDRLDF